MNILYVCERGRKTNEYGLFEAKRTMVCLFCHTAETIFTHLHTHISFFFFFFCCCCCLFFSLFPRPFGPAPPIHTLIWVCIEERKNGIYGPSKWEITLRVAFKWLTDQTRVKCKQLFYDNWFSNRLHAIPKSAMLCYAVCVYVYLPVGSCNFRCTHYLRIWKLKLNE